MAVSKHKRRYTITLTPAVVERFQTLARDIGMPPSAMSAACEEALKGVADVFQTAKDKGSIDIVDIHRLLQSQQMELIEAERRTNNGRSDIP